jgi:hypothetical protein
MLRDALIQYARRNKFNLGEDAIDFIVKVAIHNINQTNYTDQD